MAEIRIGVSGWRYAPWRGAFYPAGLPQRLELWYVARVLRTVEINGSFYSLQRPEYYAQWYEDTPEDFLFALKGPRYITHMKKLREVETPLANFFASGLFNLRQKLGPILWQFPSHFRYQRDRMEQFFALLPHDTRSARVLARKCDERMTGRSQLSIDSNRPIRHAVEIRSHSFLDESFITLLRAHNIALVVAETAKRWPLVHDVTADFVYMRLHGDKKLYQSGYGDKALERWAERIKAWHRGGELKDAEKISARNPPASAARDIYCYFDNTDVKLRAPIDAQSLMRKLGLRPGRPALPGKAQRHTRGQDEGRSAV
jgi:uncharacterized protein YecE (DUF72 family)